MTVNNVGMPDVDLTLPLPSRTGCDVAASVSDDADGTITIVSRDERGWRSAHRDHARRTGRPVLVARFGYLNKSGTLVRMTVWAPLA